MQDENLRDLGVVFSAATSSLLEHSFSKAERDRATATLKERIKNQEDFKYGQKV